MQKISVFLPHVLQLQSTLLHCVLFSCEAKLILSLFVKCSALISSMPLLMGSWNKKELQERLDIRNGELWKYQWGMWLKFMPQFTSLLLNLGDFWTGSMKPSEGNDVEASCWEKHSGDVHQGCWLFCCNWSIPWLLCSWNNFALSDWTSWNCSYCVELLQIRSGALNELYLSSSFL